MTEQIPDWIAVPTIAILGIVALYRCYILPGYLKDRESRDSQNGSWRSTKPYPEQLYK